MLETNYLKETDIGNYLTLRDERSRKPFNLMSGRERITRRRTGLIGVGQVGRLTDAFHRTKRTRQARTT